MVNADCDGSKMGARSARVQPNGGLENSLCAKTPGGPDGRVYKLTIRIEKVRPKPCPKSKKALISRVEQTMREEACSPSSLVASSKDQDKRETVCLICNESFQSAPSLYLHKKKHHRFVCQICDAYCSTKVLCERHEKLHVSDDPNLPHKCHLCPQKFDTKRNVRLHKRVMHTNVQSPILKPSSTPQQYRDNVAGRTAHLKQFIEASERVTSCDGKEKTSMTTTTTTTRRTDARTASNYGTVTFTCRVCCRDFATVEAAEAHTREHLELVEREHKCNICKKLFKNEMVLNAHLAQHLSRALRCPVCPKAFINRATLRIHMKSHG